MSTQEELNNAVASIESPVFVGRTMGELGLVKSVTRKITGKVKVELLLPVPHPPEGLDLLHTTALEPFTNSAETDVDSMDDGETAAWMEDLKTEAGPAIGGPGSRTRVVVVSSGKGVVGKSS